MKWRANRTGLLNIALEIEKSIIIQTKGRMAGASTTQFMNQKLQEETPIFSKVFHINDDYYGYVRLEAALPYLAKYDKFPWCSPLSPQTRVDFTPTHPLTHLVVSNSHIVMALANRWINMILSSIVDLYFTHIQAVELNAMFHPGRW